MHQLSANLEKLKRKIEQREGNFRVKDVRFIKKYERE
jgi:hypothetical protein